MAQRDCVKKKKIKAKSSRIMSSLMMSIAAILVIMFGAILYFVSKSKPSGLPPVQQVIVTQKPTETLPDKPQEKWTYFKELENPDSTTIENNATSINTQEKQTNTSREREQILNSFINEQNTATYTQAQSPARTNEQTWVVQCGAFNDKTNAESLRARLTIVGIEGQVVSDKLHRVIVGPFNNKVNTDKTLNQLRSAGITDCIVSK